MHQYIIQLSRVPGVDFIINRINIFLGTNGTGKSKLLQEFRNSPDKFESRPVIYIEGGRTIQIVDTLQLDQQNYNQFSNTLFAKDNHKNKHAATLAHRVKDALLLIDRLGQDVEINHSRAVVEWQKTRIGECPIREEPPLDRLFNLFEEIFPSINLNYNSESKQLRCLKNGSEYPPSQLSDGEKQVFSLLADIVILGGDNRLIIADEPELNLNPGLANRLWDLIENELPDSVFIYATHSVSFTMRANVEKIFVLSNESSNIAEIKNVKDIDEHELPALLGNIPAVLSASKALVVEGRENSIDSIIYRWLVDHKDMEIVAVGGCEDVQAVANKTGVWDALAPTVKILGVIDRDFKPSTLLKTINKDTCIILSFHEIESYLCHPTIVHEVAKGIGSVEKIPSEKEIEKIIFEEFEKEMIQIVARRVFARSTIRLAVSIEKNLLKKITDQTTLESTLLSAAKSESSKVLTEFSPEKIKQITSEEMAVCTTALTTKSIDEILSLLPGKSLLNQLAPIAGCKNALNFARAVKKHIKIEQLSKLAELQIELNKI